MKGKVVVMNYNTSSLTIYEDVDENANIEDLLISHGHNLDESLYMYCNDLHIDFIKP